MKIVASLACLAVGITNNVSAFAPLSPVATTNYNQVASSTSLSETIEEHDIYDPTLFPLDFPVEMIQGGKTVKTFPLRPGIERVQLLFKTNGRPLKCKASLWMGPLRQTHNCEMNIEDGCKTPFRYTLKFKPVGQVLRIETSDSQQLPVMAAVHIPSAERQEELKLNTEAVWAGAEKTLVQGGSTEGGGGSIRTWEIPSNVESVQFLSWAKDVGAKSFKMKIELIQGPNCVKQDFFLQCGGGSQPYHAIFETPGAGWQIRIQNKKFLEDGLYQCAVVPYTFR